MVAKVGKKKLVLVADMKPVSKQTETFETSWGKVWTHGADIMTTFKSVVINCETGETWRPPTEYRNDYLFKINRDAGYKHD